MTEGPQPGDQPLKSETRSRRAGSKSDSGAVVAPVFYVFLGPVPSYAKASLELTARHNSNELVLLAQEKPSWLGEKAKFCSLSEFYSKDVFAEFAEASPLPEIFRDGFWLKAAERFFVLNEYIKRYSVTRGFHGELDCVFYGLSELEKKIEGSGRKGFFFPRETQDRGVASLVYFNSSSSVQTVVDRLSERVSLGNEMQILGTLETDAGGPFYALPTAEYLYRSEENRKRSAPWPVVPAEPDFIVDGVVLGQWIFGIDRRNMKGAGIVNRVQNHKNSALFDLPLSQLRFMPPNSLREPMRVTANEQDWFSINAIHVHSKVHQLLHPWVIRVTLKRLNRGQVTRFSLPDRWSPRILIARLRREAILWLQRFVDDRFQKPKETKGGGAYSASRPNGTKNEI